MIAFDLSCANGHGFEGWFSSSADYETQQNSGLLKCPLCDNAVVNKIPSVPNIGRKGNQLASAALPVNRSAAAPSEGIEDGGQLVNAPALPTVILYAVQKLAAAQSEMLKQSQWVGREFAETARAIHYGESDDRMVHGEASRAEAEALAEEGVCVAPLLVPFIPPSAKN